MIQGMLDMLILKALSLAPMHGWGITERIHQWSDEALAVNQGSLYPAPLSPQASGLDCLGVAHDREQAPRATTR